MQIAFNPRHIALAVALALATMITAKCKKDTTDYKWRGAYDMTGAQ